MLSAKTPIPDKTRSKVQPASKVHGEDRSMLNVKDDRPVAIAQRKLQEMANNSPQAAQFKALQEMVNSKPRPVLFVPAVQAGVPLNTIQRYPDQMDDDNAKVLGSLYNSDYSNKKDEDYTEEELTEIKTGVFMLTPLNPDGMAANCIGWAKDSDSIESTGSIYTWKLEYTSTEADAADAKIILWGTKDGDEEDDESEWDIAHASVLLTHAEIAERSKVYGGFEEITTESLVEAGIDDPCWTSAGGFGYGVFVHPRDWFEGGDFGTALKGMK